MHLNMHAMYYVALTSTSLCLSFSQMTFRHQGYPQIS